MPLSCVILTLVDGWAGWNVRLARPLTLLLGVLVRFFSLNTWFPSPSLTTVFVNVETLNFIRAQMWAEEFYSTCVRTQVREPTSFYLSSGTLCAPLGISKLEPSARTKKIVTSPSRA